MGNIHKRTSERTGAPASPIILFRLFLDSLGVTAATGWRWRKLGWLKTLNLSGRIYITRGEIERFQERAASGEFAKRHKAPSRRRQSE
jgi:hypothetical protein